MTRPSDPPGSTPAPSDDEDDRAAILSRRNGFIAAALGSMAGAAFVVSCTPQPCLSIAVVNPDGSTPETSQTSETRGTADAALPPASADAGAIDAADAGAEGDTATRDGGRPSPCLRVAPPKGDAGRVAPPARPLPCLTPVRNPENK